MGKGIYLLMYSEKIWKQKQKKAQEKYDDMLKNFDINYQSEFYNNRNMESHQGGSSNKGTCISFYQA